MEKVKSDPKLLAEIRKFGKFDTNACFQCGSCTVVCDLATSSASFPRRLIQYSLMGLRKTLLSSLEPWLCYYCGDCSTTCPRETEPGEAMMTLRRFLTAKYDWTGITSKLSTSKTLSILAYLVAGAIMTLLIVLFHGPIITDKVELNTFAPAHLVHLFDLTVAGSVAVILFSNLFRMYWFTMHPGSSAKIPDVIKGYIKDGLGYTMHQGTKVRITLRMYLTEFKTFLQHVTTQKQFLSCPSESSKSRWLKHFFIFLGYVIMFSLVVVFLEWFQTDEIYPIYHPQRWVGYFAAAALIIFTGEIIVGRMRKREQIHKFSDFSDWMFPILLFLMAFTGIVVHVFRLMGLPLATYYSYAIHLIVAFIWLVVIIPFGKWTHLLYRSFAIYFQHVKERAVQNHLKKEVVLDHAA